MSQAIGRPRNSKQSPKSDLNAISEGVEDPSKTREGGGVGILTKAESRRQDYADADGSRTESSGVRRGSLRQLMRQQSSRRQVSSDYGFYDFEAAGSVSFGAEGEVAPILARVWAYVDAYTSGLQDCPAGSQGLKHLRPMTTISEPALVPEPAFAPSSGSDPRMTVDESLMAADSAPAQLLEGADADLAAIPTPFADSIAAAAAAAATADKKARLVVLVDVKDTEDFQLTIRENLNICVGILGYRVVRRRGPFSMKRDYAQYHVVVSTATDLYTVWRRHSEFRRLGEKVRPYFLVATMDAFAHVRRVRGNTLKPFDREFLRQRLVALELFLAALVTEMPEKDIIVDFCEGRW
ncbi:unnamed protein product [Phaeothamnion confervicola]